MAAPAQVLKIAFQFRDVKGQVSRLSCIIGDASVSAIFTDSGTLAGHLQAASLANVERNVDATKPVTYGSSGTYEDIEDKAVLTFKDPSGFLHRFQLPSPKSTCFLANQRSVNSADTNVAAIITDIETFVYGRPTDTSPLVFVAGLRVRRKNRTRVNILTLNPALTGPDE